MVLALLAALVLSAEPAAPTRPEFTGTWKLDLAASDSLDELLKAQGASWAERKLAGSVVVTQKVKLEPDAIEICIESSFKNKCTTTRIGAGWEVTKTDQGDVRTRTDWSADGQALVTQSEVKLKDGTPAEFSLTRTLEGEGKTTVQLIALKVKDGKVYKVRRVLRKQP